MPVLRLKPRGISNRPLVFVPKISTLAQNSVEDSVYKEGSKINNGNFDHFMHCKDDKEVAGRMTCIAVRIFKKKKLCKLYYWKPRYKFPGVEQKKYVQKLLITERTW